MQHAQNLLQDSIFSDQDYINVLQCNAVVSQLDLLRILKLGL